jgi:nucleoside 2-deoxyribosyltransferase
VPAVEGAGLVVLDPWEEFEPLSAALAMVAGECSPERRDILWDADMKAGARNAGLIADADGMLACLDGTDVDSGTAAEIGYGFALGLVIVGLRTDFRLASDNEGTTVNLQVEYFIVESGGVVVNTVKEAVQYLAESILL